MSSVKNIRMNGNANLDPYFAFKDKCTAKLETLSVRMKRWHASFNDPSNVSLRKDTEKVQQTLDRLRQYLGDLEKMVKVVERAPSKFPHISSQELSDRRSFVNTAKAKVSSAQDIIKSPAAKEKMLRQAHSKGGLFGRNEGALSGQGKKGGYNSLSSESGNERFMQQQKEDQSRILKEQDVVLDEMDEGLMRIGGMAESIATELDDQNKSLKDFNDEVEEAQAKMNFLMRGMSKLLKTTNNGFLCMILFLTITFCIMLLVYVNMS